VLASQVSAADCRLMVFESVDDATRLWIKVHQGLLLQDPYMQSVFPCPALLIPGSHRPRLSHKVRHLTNSPHLVRLCVLSLLFRVRAVSLTPPCLTSGKALLNKRVAG